LAIDIIIGLYVMKANRIPNQALELKPEGRKDPELPKKM
jgi:hypothetical protein